MNAVVIAVPATWSTITGPSWSSSSWVPALTAFADALASALGSAGDLAPLPVSPTTPGELVFTDAAALRWRCLIEVVVDDASGTTRVHLRTRTALAASGGQNLSDFSATNLRAAIASFRPRWNAAAQSAASSLPSGFALATPPAVGLTGRAPKRKATAKKKPTRTPVKPSRPRPRSRRR